MAVSASVPSGVCKLKAAGTRAFGTGNVRKVRAVGVRKLRTSGVRKVRTTVMHKLWPEDVHKWRNGAVDKPSATGVPLVLSPEQMSTAVPAILQLNHAHFAAQCLQAIVKLGVPDIIGAARLTVGDIVRELPEAVNEEALGRTLRLLTCSGVVEETAGPDGECMYSLTPTGALLQTKAPQPSMACGVRNWMDDCMWRSWGVLPDFVAGNVTKPPFIEHNGVNRFDFFATHPESARNFNEFMSFFSQPNLEAVVQAGPWQELSGKTVVDVGGNLGTVMAAVAEKFPTVKCVSFDLPRVIDSAGEPPKGVAFAKGDMFEAGSIPRGDAMFMKHILHDWSDKDCERILRNCHQALPARGGRVIIAEAVLPEAGAVASGFKPGIFLDLCMMLIGGKERTLRQWEALAAAAGFRVAEVSEALPTCHIITMKKL